MKTVWNLKMVTEVHMKAHMGALEADIEVEVPEQDTEVLINRIIEAQV